MKIEIKYKKNEEALYNMRKEMKQDNNSRATLQPFTKRGERNKEFVKVYGNNHQAYKK